MGAPTQVRYTLTMSCVDREGIVADLTTFLRMLGAWILEASYHSDQISNLFFTRQVVSATSINTPFETLRARFAEFAAIFGPDVEWNLHNDAEREKVAILVSNELHCLHDILGRAVMDELPMDVVTVIGNHRSAEAIVNAHGFDFNYLPFPARDDPDFETGQAAGFDRIQELVAASGAETIVLARFMRILPQSFCEPWRGRLINIHHSFLPSFVGARPYRQAHVRGVKLIGATCHYVTSDLDAGPIIEQDVLRVSHSDTIADLVRKGRDIERLVLARGLRSHLERRVLLDGDRAVVFG